jgi:flagellar biogenesis protein FliO
MDLWESMVRMASALGVVLALILALLAVARSSVGRRLLPMGGTSLIKILGTGHLGSRKQIMLVAVAGDVLILGTTATDLVLLGKITDPVQLKTLLADSSTALSSPASGAGRSDSRQEAPRASR